MEIEHLRYFLSVARYGSFSRAAASISVAQPTLSRHIKLLEDELGAPLFYRDGRGASLTEAGRYLHARSGQIVKDAQEIELGIRAIIRSPGGAVDVVLPSSISAGLAIALVQRIRTSHPQIKLKIQDGSSAHVLEWLRTGRADVALLCDPPNCATLIVQSLVREELLLFSPSGQAPQHEGRDVALADLHGLPVVVVDAAGAVRAIVDRLADRRAPVDLVELGNLRAVIDFVRSGNGHTILPLSSLDHDIAKEHLVATPLADPAPMRHLALATSTQRPITPATQAVIQALVALVSEMPGRMSAGSQTGAKPNRDARSVHAVATPNEPRSRSERAA